MLLKIFFLFAFAIKKSRTISGKKAIIPTLPSSCVINFEKGNIGYDSPKFNLVNISANTIKGDGRDRKKIKYVVLCDGEQDDKNVANIFFYKWAFKCKYIKAENVQPQKQVSDGQTPGITIKNNGEKQQSISQASHDTANNVESNNNKPQDNSTNNINNKGTQTRKLTDKDRISVVQIENAENFTELKRYNVTNNQIQLNTEDCNVIKYQYYLWPIQENKEDKSVANNQIVFLFKNVPSEVFYDVTFDSQSIIYTINDDLIAKLGSNNGERSLSEEPKNNDENSRSDESILV